MGALDPQRQWPSSSEHTAAGRSAGKGTGPRHQGVHAGPEAGGGVCAG